MTPSKFSFFVHFRKSIRTDIGLLWKPLGKLPENFYKKVFKTFLKTSYTWAQIMPTSKDQKKTKPIGTVEVVPMSAPMMLTENREAFLAKMEHYLDNLVAKDVKIAGLGALTSPLTAGGLSLKHRTDIALTNGNAFTAVIIAEGLKKIVSELSLNQPKIAIVGATGSVGSCVTKLLAREGFNDLLLVSQTMPKLQKLSESLQEYSVNATLSTDLKTLITADILIVLTASDSTLIHSEHLKHGSIILDGTQPRNTAKSLLSERPDITLIDGGLVHINSIKLMGGSIGLSKGIYFACFSETFLLALEHYSKHFCLGNATLEQADFIAGIAAKYKKFGFTLAPFSAFGQPVILKKGLLKTAA